MPSWNWPSANLYASPVALELNAMLPVSVFKWPKSLIPRAIVLVAVVKLLKIMAPARAPPAANMEPAATRPITTFLRVIALILPSVRKNPATRAGPRCARRESVQFAAASEAEACEGDAEERDGGRFGQCRRVADLLSEDRVVKSDDPAVAIGVRSVWVQDGRRDVKPPVEVSLCSDARRL